jgi:hypothetical protein
VYDAEAAAEGWTEDEGEASMSAMMFDGDERGALDF